MPWSPPTPKMHQPPVPSLRPALGQLRWPGLQHFLAFALQSTRLFEKCEGPATPLLKLFKGFPLQTKDPALICHPLRGPQDPLTSPLPMPPSVATRPMSLLVSTPGLLQSSSKSPAPGAPESHTSVPLRPLSLPQSTDYCQWSPGLVGALASLIPQDLEHQL